MSFSIGVVCSVGVGPEGGGRSRNEDNYLVCRDGRITYLDEGQTQNEAGGGEGVLLAVCDGMGGHDDGHIASATAVRVMGKLYRPGVPRDPPRALMKYVSDSHTRLHWKARSAGPVVMGTTLTAVWLLGGNAAWTQVGDSRLYIARRGKIRQITRDHTRNEFASRDGRPGSPDGEHLAQNFIYGSRGLGDDSRLRLERGRDAGMEPLEVGDFLVLCSDGVSGVLDSMVIRQVLEQTGEPQAAAQALHDRSIEQGSTDNVTALVIRVDELPDEDEDDDDVWEVDDEATIMI